MSHHPSTAKCPDCGLLVSRQAKAQGSCSVCGANIRSAQTDSLFALIDAVVPQDPKQGKPEWGGPEPVRRRRRRKGRR